VSGYSNNDGDGIVWDQASRHHYQPTAAKLEQADAFIIIDAEYNHTPTCENRNEST
jgi:hypothetical protein